MYICIYICICIYIYIYIYIHIFGVEGLRSRDQSLGSRCQGSESRTPVPGSMDQGGGFHQDRQNRRQTLRQFTQRPGSSFQSPGSGVPGSGFRV